MLNAAPVANNDEYSVLQDTVLSVNNHVPYPSPAAFPGLNETQSIAINYTASQIEFSQPHNLLFVREGETRIHVIDTNTGAEINTQSPRERFIDFDLTPDGRYLYASDYGGNGYSGTLRPSYVHRFDSVTREWLVKQRANVAFHVEAVDAERFLLLNPDSDMTLNHFGSTPAAPTMQISRAHHRYYGGFEYDHRTGRAYHGTTGSTSNEIRVSAIVEQNLVYREDTGTYGTAQSGGPTSVLSTDAEYFYYGAQQVRASSVRMNLRRFPEIIHAGTAGLAFSNSRYYSAETGEAIGELGFGTTVYGVSDHVNAVWAFDLSSQRLRHYEIPHHPLHGATTNDTDPDQDQLTAALIAGPKNGDAVLNANGTFTYTPHVRFAGIDTFTYQVTDSAGNKSNVATVTITVRPTNSIPGAMNDTYLVQHQTPLSVGKPPVNAFTYQGLTEVVSLPANYLVSQVEFAQHPGLLFVREGSTFIRTIDAATGLEIDQHISREAFTDLDLSPDGRYLFVADYGGEVAGTGKPIRPSWVHRFDTLLRQWEVKEAPKNAYRIEAVNADRFLLLQVDRGVDVSINEFGATTAAPIAEVARGYFHSLSWGDFEYDHRTGVAYHGNTESSINQIAVIGIDGNLLSSKEKTDSYGSAQAGGPTTNLSADGKYLFYGRVQVSTADVRTTQFTHPHVILASTAGIAFSENNIYSAETGEAIGTLGYPATMVTASDDGIHLITHDGTGSRLLRVYQVTPLGWGVLANDTDMERDRLTATLVSGPAHGSLELKGDGSFVYTPADGYFGNDSFTYRASDGAGTSNVATVNLTVASRPPVGAPDSYSMTEDATLEIPALQGVLRNDTDPDGQPLSAVVAEGPRNGQLTLNADGSFRYVPRANFFGTDSFTYRASDGAAISAATTVTITVSAIADDAPRATNDGFSIPEDQTLTVTASGSVLKNDTDPDGDSLTAVLVTGPANGELTFQSNGTFVYKPKPNFFGTDSFTYRAGDGTNTSEAATVTVTVSAVNDAPVITDDSYIVAGTLTVPAAQGLLRNDLDIDNAALTVQLVDGPQHGQVTVNPDGSFTYLPGPTFVFADSFTYRTSDGSAQSNVATVHLDAALRMTTENVTLTSREEGPVQGFFDVILRVAPGANLSAAGYEVSLSTPVGSGIEFLSAQLAPESPVFPGQSPVFSAIGNKVLVTDFAAAGQVRLVDRARLFRVAFRASAGPRRNPSIVRQRVHKSRRRERRSATIGQPARGRHHGDRWDHTHS